MPTADLIVVRGVRKTYDPDGAAVRALRGTDLVVRMEDGRVVAATVAALAVAVGTDPAVPGAVLALGAAASLVLAVVVALVPARRAVTLRPAQVLRVE